MPVMYKVRSEVYEVGKDEIPDFKIVPSTRK